MVVQVTRKEGSDQDEIIKAAAWAWYERGSWFEHKTIKETDFRRPQDYTPRPTRYKIEAMKQSEKPYHESKVVNSLMDLYEIERISRELNCYMESSRVAHRSRLVDGGDHGGRSVASKEIKEKRTGKKKHNRGWRRHGIVCGSSSDDVVDVVVAGVKNLRRAAIHG